MNASLPDEVQSDGRAECLINLCGAIKDFSRTYKMEIGVIGNAQNGIKIAQIGFLFNLE
jgi:hypothetical protein